VATAVVLVAAAVLALAVGAPATASGEALSPWWGLTSGTEPTNLVTGETGQIVVTAQNRGDADTSGEVTISDVLPAGLEAVGIEGLAGTSSSGGGGPVSCTLHTLTCTFSGALHPYEQIEVDIAVSVKAGASSGEQNTATVSGGGAASTASGSHAIEVDGSEKFGVEDYELIPENAGGSVDARAGSHPFQLTSVVTLNTSTPEPEAGAGKGGPRGVALAKDIVSELPAGLIADPAPFAQCGEAQFESKIPTEGGFPIDACPAQSVVGIATVTFNEPSHEGLDTVTTPIFNLTPPPGEPARFGFDPLGLLPTVLDASIRSGGDYGVTLTSSDISERAWLLSLKLTFWGVPGDPRHDAQRGWECLQGFGACPPSTATNPPPFLSLPASCEAPPRSTLRADTGGGPGHPSEQAEPVAYSLRSGLGESLLLVGCNQLPFAPSIGASPDLRDASTPSGFDIDVKLPQEASENALGLASSTVRDITIALPAGVALNPSAAAGLQACTEPEIGYLPSESEPPGKLTFTPGLPEPLSPGQNLGALGFCPSASKIGTVTLRTPLLAGPLVGAIYLAAPQNFRGGPPENPFASFVAVYLVAEEPTSGVLIKLGGKVSLDPRTGQVTASFAGTPQLPLEDIDLEFFGSERALLSTPAHCGSYATQASFVPWSGNEPVSSQSSFQITTGPNGAPCPGNPLPFSPSLAAGSTSIEAGTFSPLTVTIGREDGQQAIQSVQLKLPPGLSGILAGVPLCPEAQASAGTCGQESEIGETTLSAGLGGKPYTVSGGRVYLTGPYDGTGSCTQGGEGTQSSSCAPFGLSIVVPVQVGPFTLQEGRPVVVRAKLEIDPATAALTIVTGSIPSIIEGFPLEIQHLNITINRAGFIFNPTDCAEQSIAGTIAGDEGAGAPVSSPFEAANCATLKFAPTLAASTRANGEFQGHGASLHVVIATPTAQANLRSLKLDLPQRLPARLQTIQKACSESTFDANPAACPKASVVGSASVQTPILSTTMAGPAYLVSKTGSGTSHPGESKTEKEEAAFPNLVLVLQGQGVRIDLTGGLFVSAKNITSVTFRSIPDVPIRRLDLTLPEAKTSILAASSGFCTKRPLRMTTAITAQNGARLKPTVKVAVSGCKKPKKPKRHKQSRHRKAKERRAAMGRI
jgi:uncharacterized repeat protein (TIGR01451 family)